MLFDTDVLIWVLRGHASAVAILDEDADRRVSVVTYMELLQGARNRKELLAIRSYLTTYNIRMYPLTENIGHRASIYMEEYSLQNGMSMADALIAATAVENQARLCTANRKHFHPIRDLDVAVFRP